MRFKDRGWSLHPYWGDVSFILNQVCFRETGHYLPSSFYPLDWSYKIEDGKKKGVRTMPNGFIARPLSSIDYAGIELRIFKTNLFEELKTIHTLEIQYYPAHILYPVFDGVYRFLKEIGKDLPITRSTDAPPNTDFRGWWELNNIDFSNKLYDETSSKLFAPTPSVVISWLSEAVREYCKECYYSGFYVTDPHRSPTWDDFPYIPCRENFCRSNYATSIFSETCIGNNGWAVGATHTFNIKTPSLVTRHFAQTKCKIVMADLAPIFVYVFGNINFARVKGKWWIDRFRTNQGTIKVKDEPENYQRQRKRIDTNLSQTQPASHEVSDRNWKRITEAPVGLMCQDCAPKVSKAVWSDYFWKNCLYNRTNDYYRSRRGRAATETIGSYLQRKTDRRRNYWNYVKKESGKLEDDIYYYSHEKYKETFAKSVFKEVMDL